MISKVKFIFSWIKWIFYDRKNPVGYARSLGVKIGNNVRLISIKKSEGTFGSEPYLIKIGNNVTVSGAVQFVNHDGGVFIFRDKHPNMDVFGPIVIGNNVFIGYGAIILPGVYVGDNSVIGAGSVVTRSVDANSVVAGVPAKILKSSDQYLKDSLMRADFIRDLDSRDKRAYLVRKYMSDHLL